MPPSPSIVCSPRFPSVDVGRMQIVNFRVQAVNFGNGNEVAMKLCKALLCLLLEEEENDDYHAQKNALKNRYRSSLTLDGRRLRQRKIPRPALNDPLANTGWNLLYGSGCDQSLVTLTGFHHRSFRKLLQMFEPFWYNCSPYSEDGCIRFLRKPYDPNGGGRPRKLNPVINLGLVLTWTRTRGAQFSNQLHFGLTATPLGLWLRFGVRILNFVLRKHADARVCVPSEDTIIAYMDAIAAKYPLLGEENVWCVCDGLKLYLEQSGDAVIQSMFFNGWTQDHYVNCLFVFAPDGTIVICLINAPGSIHDSLMVAEWGRIYDKLEEVYNMTGGVCVLDSAFSKKRNVHFVLKSAQSISENWTERDILVNKEATSCRQAAEWGMRAFQGSFPCVKDQFKYEEDGWRKDILTLIIFLFNFRACNVGLNQLRSFFMPHLDEEANQILMNAAI